MRRNQEQLERAQRIELAFEQDRIREKKETYLIRNKSFKGNPAAIFTYLNTNANMLPDVLLPVYKDWTMDAKKNLSIVLAHILIKAPILLKDINAKSFEKLMYFAKLLNQAVAPIETWSAKKSKNTERILRDLQIHLFEKYTTPQFLRNASFEQRDPHKWYLWWAFGRSPRGLSKPIVPISKAVGHQLNFVPEDYDLDEALFWAHLQVLGFETTQCKALLDILKENRGLWKKKIIKLPSHDKNQPAIFWLTVAQFFKNNPEFEASDYNLIFDFIFDKKYEWRGEEIRLKDAAWTMKGRTYKALKRQAGAWHKTFQAKEAQRDLANNWPKAKIDNYAEIHYLDNADRLVTISQITSQEALFSEGRAMYHCVFTYTENCISYDTSIWTVESMDAHGSVRKLLTIEVANDILRIMQIRGRQNRDANPEELAILEDWAKKSDLTISKWA